MGCIGCTGCTGLGWGAQSPKESPFSPARLPSSISAAPHPPGCREPPSGLSLSPCGSQTPPHRAPSWPAHGWRAGPAEVKGRRPRSRRVWPDAAGKAAVAQRGTHKCRVHDKYTVCIYQLGTRKHCQVQGCTPVALAVQQTGTQGSPLRPALARAHLKVNKMKCIYQKGPVLLSGRGFAQHMQDPAFNPSTTEKCKP